MSRLVARFDTRLAEFHFDVELDVPSDGVTAVFGPSGCGKTTLLRCMAGLERSPHGVMRLGDDVWQDESRGRFLPLSQRPVGYVFQEPRLFPHLSVLANLTYGFKRVKREHRRVTVDQVVEVLGLSALLARSPGKLSGGEQQRVAIGRALLTSPRLLLMDEPLSSLDPQRKAEILPFIQDLYGRVGVPIIYVSHSVQEILQLANRLVLLKDGHIVSAGSIQEIFGRLESRGLVPDQEMGAVLDTTVVEHEEEFGLTRVEFQGNSLFVPRQGLSPGTPLRLHILSRDVSLLTAQTQGQTSALNVLEGVVVEMRTSDHDRYAVDVKIDVGCPLLATITKKSCQQLALNPGQRVFAQVKTMALIHE